MYIPTTFFGSQGACFTITTSAIAGTGSIASGSFVSGGILWDYYQFDTNGGGFTQRTNPNPTSFTASLNILSGSTGQAKILIVGGGAAGGSGASGFPSPDWAAGGGGGGGVLYYDNFPLTSGSYEIGIAGATFQTNSQATGSNGKNSYIKLPNNLTYTPFTSSFLIAYGGGGGGIGTIDTLAPITCQSTNGAPGPTTGGIGILTNQCGARTAPSTIYTTLNGITEGPQGFKGGDILATSTSNYAASGGGGAGGVGANVDIDGGTAKASNGGNGLNFNLTGSAIGVSPGGGGNASLQTGSVGTCANSGSAYGRGGQGEADGNTTVINHGLAGAVIIAIPAFRCSDNQKLRTITGFNPQTIITYRTPNNVKKNVALEGYGTSVTLLTNSSSICFDQGTGSVNNCFFTPFGIQQECVFYSVPNRGFVTYIPCGTTTPVTQFLNGAGISAVSGSVTSSVSFTVFDTSYSSASCESSLYIESGSIVTSSLTFWSAYNTFDLNKTWYDRSGNGNNATVSASAATASVLFATLEGYQPNLVTGPRTSYLAYAPNTSSLVATPSSSYTMQVQIFNDASDAIVARNNSAWLLSTGNTSISTTDFQSGLGTRDDINFEYRELVGNTNTVKASIYVPAGSAANQLRNQMYILTISCTSGSMKAYADNTYLGEASGSFFSTFGSGSNAQGITFLANLSGSITPQNYNNYRFNNILLYNKVLSTNEINQNVTYLSQFNKVVSATCP